MAPSWQTSGEKGMVSAAAAAAADGPSVTQLAERYRGEPHEVQGFAMRLSRDEWIQRRLIEEGVHEWAETAILPTFVRRGQTVLDVGANIGYYTLLLSRLVGPRGRVFAFEPNPVALAKLREHVELNRARNVEVAAVALGERRGHGLFRFDPGEAAAAGGGPPNFGGWSLAGGGAGGGNVAVTFETADGFARERGIGRVHFLKLDVEGLELEVLRGAGEILHRHRPLCLIEFQAAAAAGVPRLREIRAFLAARRYTLCRVHKRPWPHIAELADADLASTPVHFYVLAYPGRHPVHP
jgi:FkbM family methyltransferase